MESSQLKRISLCTCTIECLDCVKPKFRIELIIRFNCKFISMCITPPSKNWPSPNLLEEEKEYNPLYIIFYAYSFIYFLPYLLFNKFYTFKSHSLIVFDMQVTIAKLVLRCLFYRIYIWYKWSHSINNVQENWVFS